MFYHITPLQWLASTSGPFKLKSGSVFWKTGRIWGPRDIVASRKIKGHCFENVAGDE